MSKILTILTPLALLCCVTVTLLAQSKPEKAAESAKAGKETRSDAKISAANISDAKVDAQIETLLAMPAAERRAYLKKLAPEERRGLWMKLKRTQVTRRGKEPARYQDLKGHPVTVGPKRALPTKAVGTITYDSGAPAVAFGGGAIVGNRFNTHTGLPVLASGTVETVQAVVVPGSSLSSSTAGFVLLGPQTTMGGAFALFSSFTAATGTMDTLTFAGLGVNYTGSSYFVLFGDFASSYVPVLGTGTNLGQGRHGLVGYTGGMGPDIVGTFNLGNGLNAFVRTTGNVVPVELMSFDVE